MFFLRKFDKQITSVFYAIYGLYGGTFTHHSIRPWSVYLQHDYEDTDCLTYFEENFVQLGFYLIFIGLGLILLNWIRHRTKKDTEMGEIKFGNMSIKASAGILILVIGVIVYLLEKGYRSM